jgi:uncharacterized protein YqjF (DUF2071 family)
MRQTWNDLLFAHWPVPAETLRTLVPSTLPLDQFEGRCWLAVTPFHMSGVRLRGAPPFPGVSAFPEMNVRTYVTYGGKPGIFFLSLDAGSRLACWAARLSYRLPYYSAEMAVRHDDAWIRYQSVRRGKIQATFRGAYRPVGEARIRGTGTLEQWLSERYCLYTHVRGKVFRGEIHHAPWALQDAEAMIAENTMAGSAGITLPDTHPLLHFAKRLDVLFWPLKSA